MIKTNIWAARVPSGACVKIPYKGYEISIACDDSCGGSKNYTRSYIRVFTGPNMEIDVTMQICDTNEILGPDAGDIKDIFTTIDSMEKDHG